MSDLNQARKIAKAKAVERLVKTRLTIYREEIDAEIRFNVKGIKECINQPFSNYIAKIDLVRDNIEEALKTAKYVGFTDKQTHPKAHILGYHFFETTIAGETAYFNVQVTIQNELYLYSVTQEVTL
ncbi:LPD3 domain-containing protein [Larkinella rosea]|uniref:Large polyvalent protein-associated domain-containing protein n=1 Tax=Larkinella rosea TaxID=2025312 RepID=A0A3P1BEK8_9BACT|nr:hypothetical protein [Larkinella rosea]RRA99478.1 hypothetical protein EHT25_26390 [Larkinella rosea]